MGVQPRLSSLSTFLDDLGKVTFELTAAHMFPIVILVTKTTIIVKQSCKKTVTIVMIAESCGVLIGIGALVIGVGFGGNFTIVIIAILDYYTYLFLLLYYW